jgi:periplasmic copper chaperone A
MRSHRVTKGTAVRIASTVGVLVLLLAAPAAAHVAVSTDNARPGATGTVKIHVPSESDTADTVKIELRLPEGFAFVGGKPAKGWTASADGNIVTIEGGTIPPGGEQDFRIRIQNGREAGEHVFPAIQTYSDGERVRWTGAEGSDAPAAVMTVAGKPVKQPADPPQSETSAPPAPASEPEGEPTTSPSPSADSGGSEADAGPGATPIIVLVVVVIAAGITAGVLRSRRA